MFRGNTAVGGNDAANATYRQSAGGAFLHNGSGTVISGSRFVSNSVIGGNDTGSGHLGSARGGAIESLGQDPSISIFDTTFVSNSAVGGRRLVAGESIDEPASGEASGGAISSENGTITIGGGSFTDNKAIVRTGGPRLASGGAIDIAVPDGGHLSYLNTTAVRFTSNVAESATGSARGGAIAFNGTALADNGSTFRSNAARSGRQNGSAYGGALFLQSTSQLSGSVLTQNRASAANGYGGGVALPLGPEVLTQTQTTIRQNRATTAGNELWWPTTS